MTIIKKVSQKGWVVIPAELRRRYGLEPGAMVTFAPREDGVEVMPAMKDAIRETAGKYRVGKPALTETLLKEREREKAREERRIGR